MRTLFWILLLGNVILFAVMQRGGLGWGEQAYQPQPALHAENIRLLDMPQLAPAKALSVSPPTAAPVATSAQIAASAPVAIPAPAAKPAPATGSAQVMVASQVPAVNPASVAVKQNTLICLEWGEFSGADLKRAKEELSALQLGDKLSQRQVEYNKGYWVYIPPLKNKAAASKKIAQLRALGVKEYFIVQAGAFRYSISLGVFKTQEAAQNHLKELRAKGLRTAQVGERASKLNTTMFVLNNVDASTEGKLAATRQEFPGSELKNVPCTLTR